MINKFDDVRGFPEWEQDAIETPEFEVLKTLTFNESTKWTNSSKPKELIEYGKVPPLGVKDIHAKGVTGKGINVAIIDQQLALGHPEYKDQIAEYKTFGEAEKQRKSSLHGPAVTSLLAGKTIGTAPDAKIYYAACPQALDREGSGGAKFEAEALEWIIQVNQTLPEGEKIKFVSASTAPDKRLENPELWTTALKKAEAAGIVVVDASISNGFLMAGYVDYQDKSFKDGFPEGSSYKRSAEKMIESNRRPHVSVPNSLRTAAESYDDENFGYTFYGCGGFSWAMPYVTGILALGQQMNNELSADKLKQLLIESATRNNGVIDPKGFLKAVQSQQHREVAQKSEREI